MTVQTVEVVVRRSNADRMVTKVIVGLQARAAVARDSIGDETSSVKGPAPTKRRQPIVNETSCFWASGPLRCGYRTARRPSLCR